VIETAWRKGAKFDAWQDQFNFNIWMDAFDAHGISPDFYTSRPRSANEAFPWDHIHTGVSRKFLLREYQRSMRGELTPDCREGCHACGILTEFSSLRRENTGELWLCPEVN